MLFSIYACELSGGFVTYKTPKGKAFVDRLKGLYKDYKDYDQEGEYENKLIKEGMAFVYAINEDFISGETVGETAVHTAHDHWTRDDHDEHSLSDALLDELSKNALELADEIEVTPENIQEFTVMYGSGIDVKPSEFLANAKKGNFTDKDKIWATGLYHDLLANVAENNDVTFDSSHPFISMGDFMVNGKPMFTKDELEGKQADTLPCRIVESILRGNDVSVKVSGKENDVCHLNPKFEEIQEEHKEPKQKSFWDKVYDFFMDLFGKTKAPEVKERDKVATIQSDLSDSSARNKAAREKTSFDELIGKDAFKKVTAPPAKKNDLTAEHKLEKGGMSSGF